VDPLLPLVRTLHERSVRFVLIGVAGANYYAMAGSDSFLTQDRDLFLPLDSDNLVASWAACEAAGLGLWSGQEPLDWPHDRWLADRVIERRVLTRAAAEDMQVDLTLVMEGFEFETVWNERRTFKVDHVDIPVARLLHIVQSKHATGCDKDCLFLATHRDALEQLFEAGRILEQSRQRYRYTDATNSRRR